MSDSLISENKYSRVLQLYLRLSEGEVINKAEEAKRSGKSTKSIQNDIEDLRSFIAERAAMGGNEKEIIYDKKLKGYYLKGKDETTLTNSEILAVCKILLESRAFCKSDISPIIEKLIYNCVPHTKQQMVKMLISNELFHYVEPHHGKHFIENLWDIGEAIYKYRYMDINYERLDGKSVKRRVKPVGIMFSEFYFYLTAFIDDTQTRAEFRNPDDIFPTIYRIDRIKSFEISKETFDIPYASRFEEGEFRKRVQFMYGGRLRKLTFIYKGVNPESVLDRLPTAKIISHDEKGYIITAEVFGDGIDMWVRSQGDNVEMLNS